MTPAILLARLETFALEVLAATKPMCRAAETTDMARQLRRAGTGAYMNYGAASVARSHADFTSKVGIAFEELRAILSAAHLTAKRNRRRDG